MSHADCFYKRHFGMYWLKKTINKMKKLLVIMVVALIAITGCKKGDAGPKGDNGINGNANVKSTTVNVVTGDWAFDNTDNSWTATLTVGDITNSVASTGSVMAYVGGSGVWIAIPYSSGNVQYNYGYGLNEVDIIVTLANGTVPGNPGSQQFKIVSIPASSMAKHQNVDYKDYNEVQKTFNLN